MRKTIDMVLSRIIVFIMIILTLDVLLQVATDFIIKESNPFSFTDELAEFLLIWTGLLGAAYATGKKQHLAIKLINYKLKSVAQKRLNIFINVLISLFALVVLVIGGIRFVIINMKLDQLSPAMEIPMWYVYLALPLSGAFIMFYAIDETRGI